MPHKPKTNIAETTTENGVKQHVLTDEKLCRAMINSIIDYAVILTDPEGIIISLNKGAELILGYKEVEVTEKSIAIFYDKETLEADGPVSNLQEALVNNNYQIKGWRVKKSGIKFFANIHYTALYDENHELLGFTKIIYDLSDNRQVEETAKIKHNPDAANISFRKLFENSYSGITLLDKDLNLIYRSQSAERISGWSAVERQKNNFDDLIHPDDGKKVSEVLKEVLVSPGISKTSTFRSRHFKGHYLWMECVFTNFLDEPNVNAIVCNFRDITESKTNQEKVAENERFIKTITDNLPALIAYWDAGLHCRFANKPYANWFEKTPDEMMGISKMALMNGLEFQESEIYIQAVLSGEHQSFERTFIKPNGGSIFTHTQYIPDIQKNEVKGFYSLVYDITEIKHAEQEIRKKSEQIEDLLENITDGFIALDENLRYTYVNKQIGALLGMPQESLLGKYIWDIFPDSVGTKTYEAIQKSFTERINVNNEDYYAPLNLWQENRVYPSGNGVSVFIRDITKKKEEEHHLKLLESVITETTDSVMITEAEPQHEPGPRILYVNDAFTKMTGYSAAEIIGKSPRFLQGPKTDQNELKRLSDCMRKWESCEASVINYKKTGEEFWINFAVTPVADEKGWYTHWIAVERDITARKIEEQQKALVAKIGSIFNEPLELNPILEKALSELADFGDFSLTEAWLVSADKRKINLAIKFYKDEKTGEFYDDKQAIKSFVKGEGLPGIVWESEKIQYFADLPENEHFLRRKAARRSGLTSAYVIPIHFKSEVIGVLLLGLSREHTQDNSYTTLFENFSNHFGAEIKRKQLEQELNQVFNFAPDIICITGTDSYFKKVNPAMLDLLQYSELELLNRPFINFIHPSDHESTMARFYKILEGEATVYFECRFLTRSGKIKWLAWTTTPPSEEGLIFCVAKDITEKKELEKLLNKANNLARIGGWEIDLLKGTIYWSDITREIHEAEADFVPNLETGISFYKEGISRDYITQKIKDAIETGNSWDVELQIVTAKGHDKWVRAIGEAEMADNRCVRIYGSFQDIDVRKRAEISVTEVLEERNIILESIGDAFFAVDRNWTVNYWNNMAEKVLGIPKEAMLNRNLWEVFSDSVDSESYKMYHQAIERNEAGHFEDYYPPLKKWYEISAYPSDTGLSVYFKDITDRKTSDTRLRELNESLQQQTKELASSNAELEQFAYVASHDLQEPLRMVTGFLTQIERKYGEVLDDKGKQYINFAVDGAKRMRQIILDLLEFSRVGTIEDNLENIGLDKLVSDITALYRKQIEEKKAVILFDGVPIIQTYKTPLRQVLQNLVGNSLKYSRSGADPVLRISCSETASHWQISVKDNGIGIEPEYFDKIFIIFQRLHNKNEYSGTGMGLAIAKKIIENLGGTIWVKSEIDQGATFYFTILKPKT